MFGRIINTSLVSNLEAAVCGCLRACNFIKKRLQDSCFPVKFAKFLRAPFFKEHLPWLLLKFSIELSG